jgi:hypothetical protein
MPHRHLFKYKEIFYKNNDFTMPYFLVLSPSDTGELTSTFVLNGARFTNTDCRAYTEQLSGKSAVIMSIELF